MNRKERLSSCRLYGIADMGYTAEHQLISVTEKLLAGGLGILQLRAKNHDPEHIARMGSRLAPLCREYGCLFIINDYPEIALGTGADGVHLGQDDGELAPVRAMLGANAIITCKNRLLLEKRSDSDVWGLVGGGCKKWETGRQAIVREVYEELGLRIAPERFRKLAVYDNPGRIAAFRDGSIWRMVIVVYALELEEEPEMHISRESKDLRFFSREEIGNIEIAITHRDIVDDWFVKGESTHICE